MVCSERVKCFVRIRPLNRRESQTIITQPTRSTELKITNRHEQKFYNFEKIFPEDTSQQQIYDQVVFPLVLDVSKGINCTIFAYGQTSSGKTYTMEGKIPSASLFPDPDAGMVPRALLELHRISLEMDSFLEISYIQIYNEEIFDLLADKPTKLTLYSTKEMNSVVLKGVRLVKVDGVEQMFNLLRTGVANRNVAATDSNFKSSRSHSVCTVILHQFHTTDGIRKIMSSKFNLVDLAGSENIGRSGSVSLRAREAGKINQSLLTLGRVIKALTERAKHVPYRESRLTRILEDSLGGRTRTCIFATVSPSLSSLDETLSTLDYATMAEKIENKPQHSQIIGKPRLLEMYEEEIARLSEQLAMAQAGKGVFIMDEDYNEIMLDMAHQQQTTCYLRECLDGLRTERDSVDALFGETCLRLREKEHELEGRRDAIQRIESLSSDIKRGIVEADTHSLELADEYGQIERGSSEGLERIAEITRNIESAVNTAKELNEERARSEQSNLLLNQQLDDVMNSIHEISSMINDQFSRISSLPRLEFVRVDTLKRQLEDKSNEIFAYLQNLETHLNRFVNKAHQENENFFADVFCEITEMRRMAREIDWGSVECPSVPPATSAEICPLAEISLEELGELSVEFGLAIEKCDKYKKEYCEKLSEFGKGMTEHVEGLVAAIGQVREVPFEPVLTEFYALMDEFASFNFEFEEMPAFGDDLIEGLDVDGLVRPFEELVAEVELYLDVTRVAIQGIIERIDSTSLDEINGMKLEMVEIRGVVEDLVQGLEVEFAQRDDNLDELVMEVRDICAFVDAIISKLDEFSMHL